MAMSNMGHLDMKKLWIGIVILQGFFSASVLAQDFVILGNTKTTTVDRNFSGMRDNCELCEDTSYGRLTPSNAGTVTKSGYGSSTSFQINWSPTFSGDATFESGWNDYSHSGDCGPYQDFSCNLTTPDRDRQTISYCKRPDVDGGLTGTTLVSDTSPILGETVSIEWEESGSREWCGYPLNLRIIEVDGVEVDRGVFVPYIYQADEIGVHRVDIYIQAFFGEVHGPYTENVTVQPRCYTATNLALNLTGPGVIVHETGFEVVPGNTYTVGMVGHPDASQIFSEDYELVLLDGDSDVNLNGSQLTVTADIGSYTLRAVRKPGREICVDIPDTKVFVGGGDVVLERFCDIILPDDLPDFDIDLDPEDVVFEHFAATVRSDRAIVVKPGIKLTSGAELFLEPGTPLPTTDLDRNFVETKGYNEYGELQSASRSYFDGIGRPTQTQYQDLEKNIILASELLYDARGRVAITTANAPVWKALNPPDDACPTQLPGNDLVFEYKEGFITAGEEDYDRTKFDQVNGTVNNELTPAPVDNTEEGTLGWYYSANNGTSPEAAFNEPLVDHTGYPYSRTLFHHDGTEDPKGQTLPGDTYVAGSGILAEGDKEGVADDDPFLTPYGEMVRDELGLTFPTTFAGDFHKVVATDANGKRSVVYQDKEGNALMSLYYGPDAEPITKSYQFYDEVGRLLHSVTPNGAVAYEGGTPFADLDKTSYIYDGRGFLSDLFETDGGHTQYLYRQDGSIRFSQNAEQRKDGRYSYTQYDEHSRPIESGEYLPTAEGVAFNSPEMLTTNFLQGGRLNENQGQHFDRVETVYDVPDLGVWGGQYFVQGRVSKTIKEGVSTTWYSYDYLGRIAHTVHAFTEFGTTFRVSYSYGPDGNMTETKIEEGAGANGFFTHYYDYDKDGRLTAVSTEAGGQTATGFFSYPRTTNARYHYYSHGPLKRVELGEDIQGIDYVYTADGKLKAINDGGLDNDPGNDSPATTGFATDHFGQTLTYHDGDYRNGFHTPMDMVTTAYPDQFNGNIKGQRWHNATLPTLTSGYAYRYDKRDQLLQADFGFGTGVFSKHPDWAYEVDIDGYDPNGNIIGLSRRNVSGTIKDHFRYQYVDGANQLQWLFDEANNSNIAREPVYNAIGQLSSRYNYRDEIYDTIAYDVTGKVTQVTEITSTGSEVGPKATYTYDDRGFRLSKTLYNASSEPATRTWYIRDMNGQVLVVYEEDLATGSGVFPIEYSIYGASRIGMYKPNSNTIFYELQDHLGNVRTVIGDPLPTTFTASMELSAATEEETYFQSLPEARTTVPDFINHTPGETNDKAIRLNNVQAEPRAKYCFGSTARRHDPQ